MISVALTLCRIHVHVVNGPQMAVQVNEAPMIHEPMIFRFSVQFPAQGDRGIHDLIDLFPALEGQCDRHLRILARINGFLLRERIKECLIDQHDLQVVADHDGYRILILGELRVELESESGEERFRKFYVFYRQVEARECGR